MTFKFNIYEDSGNDSLKHFAVKLKLGEKIISKARATSKKKAEEIAAQPKPIGIIGPQIAMSAITIWLSHLMNTIWPAIHASPKTVSFQTHRRVCRIWRKESYEENEEKIPS